MEICVLELTVCLFRVQKMSKNALALHPVEKQISYTIAASDKTVAVLLKAIRPPLSEITVVT